ncbi:adenine phosphoribosyltransferase [Geotoga petraea]|uniref:Adenine phosphoribosyltransferase n=1 Tax=Geotoga petraea TaxID=28234 RepID=A0A4Z0W3E3_9BACT|nr:adenine phosphoribosyltransferase [Geotoga petraea]TGG87972.1 adenine phosphoribosyltransferase [Geotoga petraea]
MKLKNYVRDIPDFPKEGIVFKDITPALKSPEAFKYTIDSFQELVKDWDFDAIIGPESRGFIYSTPMAYNLNKPFIPVRKPGKLPAETISFSYDLEYGSGILEMHKDAISKGDKVIIVDDILATGGTTEAIIKLVEKAGGKVVGALFLAELTSLNPREKLTEIKVESLIKY